MEVLWLCVKLKSLVFFKFSTQFELDFKSICTLTIIVVSELVTSFAIIIFFRNHELLQY